MSLTSRLFSLITSDSSSDAQSQVASKHNGFADSLLQPGSIRQNTGLRAMEATIEEDLEAKRPPYWQVSTPTVYIILRPNVCTEHACRWNWRHQRRYCYALARHGQNKTARRSSLSTQVLEPVQFVRYNFQARRPPERVVWRFRSGYARVFPRDSSILRIL
jgi:hypothetical protein